jgi:hypothetical protein
VGPAYRGYPRPRARLGLEPESGHGAARPPPARCPGPARQGPLGRPIKPPSRALGSAHPAAAASLPRSPSLRRLHHQAPGRRRLTAALPLHRPRPLPKLRMKVDIIAGPFSRCFPAFSRAQCLAGAPRPRAAVVRPPQPPAPCPNPLNMFPSLISSSQTKPESKLWPESRLRDFPTSLRHPPPQILTAGASAGAHAASTPCSRPIEIRRSRIDLDRCQITRYQSTLGYFAL